MYHGPEQRQAARRSKVLRISQASVANYGPCHDIALALAERGRFDVVLLQEPFTAILDDKPVTKTHRAYRAYTPLAWADASDKPRVMTYV